MTKKELRVLYREKRRQLSQLELSRLDDLLLIRFQQQPLGDIQAVLTYWPIQEKWEVNVQLMVDYLLFRLPGLQLSFPVIDNQEYTFRAILVDDDTTYRKNSYGIAEPISGQEIPVEEIDLVLVPLLAFDKKGFRVGYGKGFYDRFLKTCRGDVLKIGFSYFEPEEVIDDINEFDVPLNICITPNNIYEF